MANSYLQTSEITDLIVKPAVTQDYCDRAANEFLDLVQLRLLQTQYKGLSQSEMTALIVTPVHYVIKRWMVAWCTMTILQEIMFHNNVDVSASEKYFAKYEIYKKLESDMRSAVTPEMILGRVIESNSRAPITGRIERS